MTLERKIQVGFGLALAIVLVVGAAARGMRTVFKGRFACALPR